MVSRVKGTTHELRQPLAEDIVDPKLHLHELTHFRIDIKLDGRGRIEGVGIVGTQSESGRRHSNVLDAGALDAGVRLPRGC